MLCYTTLRLATVLVPDSPSIQPRDGVEETTKVFGVHSQFKENPQWEEVGVEICQSSILIHAILSLLR